MSRSASLSSSSFLEHIANDAPAWASSSAVARPVRGGWPARIGWSGFDLSGQASIPMAPQRGCRRSRRRAAHPELRVGALAAAILPRAATPDERGPSADGGNPVPHRLGDELGAFVGANVAQNAAPDEQVRCEVDDIRRPELAVDRIARHSRVCASIRLAMRSFPSNAGPVLDEVGGPDLVRSLWPQLGIQPAAVDRHIDARADLSGGSGRQSGSRLHPAGARQHRRRRPVHRRSRRRRQAFLKSPAWGEPELSGIAGSGGGT